MLIKDNFGENLRGETYMYRTGDFSNTELIELVNNIYDWNTSTDGVVDPTSLLRKTYDEKVGKDGYPSMSQFSEDITREAAGRFEKLIKTTMRTCPYLFIAK